MIFAAVSVLGWQANVSLPIIGRVLGDATPQATMVYARLSLAPQWEAMDLATTNMLTTGGKAKLLAAQEKQEGADDAQRS